MAAISGPKVGTVSTWLPSSRMPMPMPSPKSAVMMGRPMAMREPKATSRMTMAASRPMASLDPMLGCSTRPMGWPPSSTWKPGLLAASAAATSRFTSAFLKSDSDLVSTTGA